MYRLFSFVPDKSAIDFKGMIRQIGEIFAPDKEVKIAYDSKNDQKVVGFEWPDKFRLVLALELKPDKKKAQDIVQNYAPKHPQKDVILNSQATISIEGDSDPEMNHFNDYVYLTQIIEKIPGIILWDPESYNFIDPKTGDQKKYY